MRSSLWKIRVFVVTEGNTMAKYATHITVLLCFIVAGISAPLTVRELRKPVAPVVQPDDVPVVDTFAVDLREAFDDLSAADQRVFRDHVDSIMALCRMPCVKDCHVIEDTEVLQMRIANARMGVYGTVDPLGENDKSLNAVLMPKVIELGMLSADTDSDGHPDEVKPFDPDMWYGFYEQVKRAIE
jgi:hypothetical protein